jgi:hypothetical protein
MKQWKAAGGLKKGWAELTIAAQSAALVRVDFEDGEQLGQLQEIVHLFRQV